MAIPQDAFSAIRKVVWAGGAYVVISTSRSGVSNGNHPPSAPYIFLSHMPFNPETDGNNNLHINFDYLRNAYPIGAPVTNPPSTQQKFITRRWGGNAVVDLGVAAIPAGGDLPPRAASGYADGTVVHDLEFFNINAIRRARPDDDPVFNIRVTTAELHAVDENAGGGGTPGEVIFIWGSYPNDPHTAYPDATFPTFTGGPGMPFWLATQPDAITQGGSPFPHIGLFANSDVAITHPEFGPPPYDPGAGGTFPTIAIATLWAQWAAPYMAAINGSINIGNTGGTAPPAVHQSTQQVELVFELYNGAPNFTFDANNNPTWTATPKTRIVKTVGGTAPIAAKTFRVTYSKAAGLEVEEATAGPS